MKEKKHKGRYDAAAIHDGQSWHLLAGADLREIAAPVAGPANRLPQTLVDLAVGAQSRSVRFLIAGEVHRMEGAIPKGMSLERANGVIRASIAEATGVETESLLVAGATPAWAGTRKPFSLAGRFDGDMAEDFNATLAEAGLACAGFASLELAMMAAWRPSRDHSLVIVGTGHSFLVPAARGANAGPQTVACGLRHFAMDAANGLARLQRAIAGVGKENPLHVVVPSLPHSEIAAALRGAGYANVVEESRDEWLASAARTALLAKPNRTHGVAVPVANPWEPRRKFSNGWLLLAAAAVFALPALFRWGCEVQSRRACAALAAEAAAFRPLEEKIKKARNALSAAQAEKAAEEAAQKARMEMRRPLVSFIDVAYFFCKHAGRSLTLEAIEQSGERIEVRGAFSDPEDGVRLNEALLAYAKERCIGIVKNEAAHDESGDAAFVNRFTLVLDCSKTGEVAK